MVRYLKILLPCLLFVFCLETGFGAGLRGGDSFNGRRFSNILNGHGLPKNGNRWPFGRGSVWFSAAANSKMIVYPVFGQVSGIPWMASAEYSFNDHFAFGAYGGFYQGTYTEPFGSDTYESKLRSYVYGLRLTFHFADIFNRTFLEVVNTRRWDLYATLTAGIVHYDWNVSYKYLHYRDFSPKSFGSVGGVVGIRYCPIPRLGFFAEVGKGVFGYYGFGAALKIVK